MNEQIEEIKRVICESDVIRPCLDCGVCRRIAENVYNVCDRKQSEWISVEDRLPKKEGLYLVYTKKGYIEIDRFAIFDVGYYWVELEDYVTHWMPLPEPPKMKGGAE